MGGGREREGRGLIAAGSRRKENVIERGREDSKDRCKSPPLGLDYSACRVTRPRASSFPLLISAREYNQLTAVEMSFARETRV